MRERVTICCFSLLVATTLLGADDCKSGRVAFDNGLAFTIPDGYCAVNRGISDYNVGDVTEVASGRQVLHFYAGFAGGSIDGLRPFCPGSVIELPASGTIRYGSSSGSLMQRSRTSILSGLACRDVVFFARAADGSESGSLLVFTYRGLPGRLAQAMDKVIDSVTPAEAKTLEVIEPPP